MGYFSGYLAVVTNGAVYMSMHTAFHADGWHNKARIPVSHTTANSCCLPVPRVSSRQKLLKTLEGRLVAAICWTLRDSGGRVGE